MEVVLWPWDERSSIWWLKTPRPVTCSNNRSSPSMTAWFHCMISENGSSQPLLSNTGMQAACTQQNTETHIIVFRVIQRHDGGTKRFILYRNDHKTPLKTHLSSVRHITSHHYTSTTRRVCECSPSCFWPSDSAVMWSVPWCTAAEVVSVRFNIIIGPQKNKLD